MIDQASNVEIRLSPLRRSPTCGAICAAIAKAQGAFLPLQKDREVEVKGVAKNTGKEFNYTFSYATLDAAFESVRKPLADNELCYVQSPSTGEKRVTVTTFIGHSSGEWFEGDLELFSSEFTPQSVGGVITYARRYAICAMLGLAAEEDDDANEASGNQRQITNRAPIANRQRTAADEANDKLNEPPKSNGNGAAKASSKADKSESPPDGKMLHNMSVTAIDKATGGPLLLDVANAAVERWTKKIYTDEQFRDVLTRIRVKTGRLDDAHNMPQEIGQKIYDVLDKHTAATV